MRNNERSLNVLPEHEHHETPSLLRSFVLTHTYSHSLSTWPKSGTTTVQVIDAPKKENRLWGVEFGLRYILLRKYASACMHNYACRRVANEQ